MRYSPTVLVLLVTVALLVGLAAVACRYRTRPGATLFGALQALSAVWAALAIVGLQLPPNSAQLRVWGFGTGLSLIVVIFWLAFILSYTGRENFLRPLRFGVATLPLVVGAGLYFVVPSWSPLVGDIQQTTISIGTVVQPSIGPVGSILGVYIYLVFLAGLAVVVKTIVESNSLFVGQGVALVLGTLVTVVASFLGIIGVPVSGYPTTEVALGGQSLFWGYAVFGQQFLQVVPAVAAVGERAVFHDLEDGIIVVDNGGTVTRANPAARTYLDIAEVNGDAIGSVLDKMGVATLGELPARFQFQGQAYRAKTSPITNWRGDTIGQTVVIQNTTSLIRRQQRLQVLNRILRHNVRNDMTVIRLLSSQLQRRDGDELARIGGKIEEKADDLITISEKAIGFNRIIDGTVTAEPVELEALVTEIVPSVATQHPDATLKTDISVGEVTTAPEILSLVLEEVVTNAVEHAGDSPEVLVRAEPRDDGLELTVTDDGPGIPQMEIDPLVAGRETDLHHASSLGLWLVHWGAQSLGGDVEFATSEDGTVVILSLPGMGNGKAASTRPASERTADSM